MTDYNGYHFTVKELWVEIVRAVLITSGTGWLFFGNLAGCILLLPAGFLLIKERSGKKNRERISRLRGDFKEFVLSFSASVQAGYTMEQAVTIGARDLRRIHPGETGALLSELEWMERQMKLRVPCDALFSNLAVRTGLEEIRSFAVVMNIGRRQGGNLVQITRRTAEHMNRKIQVHLEVEQSLAGRSMEKDIMFIMPYFMLLYLRITNSSYMEVLFSNIYGRVLMLACLILLWIAGKWADRIITIRL